MSDFGGDMRILDLFSGIGGFSLGFEWAGLGHPAAFVEIDDYACKVLRKHWPDVPIYNDVRTFGKEQLNDIGHIDLICAGFPCQDISVAGKQKGLGQDGARTRSGLFFEIIRIITLCKPRWVVLENVAALLSRPDWMGAVLGSLAEIGYDAEWEIIQASDMGAPHKRARVWIVAYSTGMGQQQRPAERGTIPETSRRAEPNKRDKTQGKFSDSTCIGTQGRIRFKDKKALSGNDGNIRNVAHADKPRMEGGKETGNPESEGAHGNKYACRFSSGEGNWTTEPDVGRVAHGIPSRVNRLKCLGNAIVPQIAELIGRRIKEIEA